MSKVPTSGAGLGGIISDGTCIHDVVMVGSCAWTSVNAILSRISEFPRSEPLQRPRTCMVGDVECAVEEWFTRLRKVEGIVSSGKGDCA